MVTLDAGLKALAALVAATFALVALAASRERRPNAILAAFLALIAGNQAVEAFRAAGSGLDDVVLMRIAAIFASLDPLVFLWAFARSEDDERLARLLPAAAIASGGFALYAGFRLGVDAQTSETFTVALTLATALLYSFVAVRLARRLVDRRSLLVFASASIVALPVWVQLPQPAFTLWGIVLDRPLEFAVLFLDLGIPAAIAWFAYARAPPDATLRPAARRALLIALGLCVLVNAFHVLRLVAPIERAEQFVVLGRASAALRWLLFSGIMSVVLLREDGLRLTLAYRRRAARLVIGLALLTGAGYLLALANVADDASLSWPVVGFLLAVLALSQGFRGFTDRVAARLYGVPPLGAEAARHEAYREAIASLVRSGRRGSDEKALARLRAELELDPATALAIERTAELIVSAPLANSAIVAGRYRIERLLGRGGAGRTFLAKDLLLRRDVAIKEVFRVGGPGDAMREARLMATLRHPNVVQVLDVVQRLDSDLVIEEYVPGGTLADRLARGPLGEAETRRVLAGVLDALRAVHSHGIVHRDLKPPNILFDESGQPKIADFGIAHRGDETPSAAGAAFGTFGYAAPEQHAGAPPAPAADIYGVGVLGVACLGEVDAPGLAAVLAKAREPDPERRWRDAAEMLEALRTA